MLPYSYNMGEVNKAAMFLIELAGGTVCGTQDIYRDFLEFRRFPEDTGPDPTYFAKYDIHRGDRLVLHQIFKNGEASIRGKAAAIKRRHRLNAPNGQSLTELLQWDDEGLRHCQFLPKLMYGRGNGLE